MELNHDPPRFCTSGVILSSHAIAARSVWHGAQDDGQPHPNPGDKQPVTEVVCGSGRLRTLRVAGKQTLDSTCRWRMHACSIAAHILLEWRAAPESRCSGGSLACAADRGCLWSAECQPVSTAPRFIAVLWGSLGPHILGGLAPAAASGQRSSEQHRPCQPRLL
jgi:hypothetical protein